MLSRTQSNVVTAILLLIPVCQARAQDRDKADAAKKVSSDGSIIKYDPLPADWASRGAGAMKICFQAFALMDHEDFLNAEKLFRQAQQLDYPNGMAQKKIRLGLAELYARQKRYPEAIKNFFLLHTDYDEHDIEADPLVNMEFALALAEAKEDWWAKAVEEYELALVRMAISSPAYLKSLASLTIAERQVEPNWHQFQFSPAEVMSQERMIRCLPQEWNVQFRRDTPNYGALQAMAHLYIGTHNYAFRKTAPKSQLAHLRDAIHYDPENPYAYYEYGMKLNEMRQYQDAKNAFMKAGKLAGSNADLSLKAKAGLHTANVGIETTKR